MSDSKPETAETGTQTTPQPKAPKTTLSALFKKISDFTTSPWAQPIPQKKANIGDSDFELVEKPKNAKSSPKSTPSDTSIVEKPAQRRVWSFSTK